MLPQYLAEWPQEQGVVTPERDQPLWSSSVDHRQLQPEPVPLGLLQRLPEGLELAQYELGRSCALLDELEDDRLPVLDRPHQFLLPCPPSSREQLPLMFEE